MKPKQAVTICALNLYPLKSAGRVMAWTQQLTPIGFEKDRIFVLKDRNGKFMSQRSHPQMGHIETTFLRNHFSHGWTGDAVSFRAKDPLQGNGSLIVKIDDAEVLEHSSFTDTTVTIHGDSCPGVDLGDEYAKWFSEVLGEPCRLIRQVSRMPRVREATAAGGNIEVSFADGYPVLIMSLASVLQISEWLKPFGLSGSARMFRPNIVIQGDTNPFFEDDLIGKTFKLGGAKLKAVKACSRCSVVDVDLETGKRNSGSPVMGVLAEHRQVERFGKGVFVGVNCIVLESGKVSVRDELILLD